MRMNFRTHFIMHFSVVSLLCLAASVLASDFRLAEDVPPPTQLRMLGQSKMPYLFKRGQVVQAEVDFVPEVPCNELKMKIRVKLTSNWFDYPMEERNACNDLVKGRCPLQPGVLVTFRMKMPVRKKYPKINIHVEIKLFNELDQPVCGFQISGKTVD